MLRLVHLDGPLSRATLTEATGLNRSTIADLVGELVAARTGRRARARPVASGGPSVPRGRGCAPRGRHRASTPRSMPLTIAAVGLDRSISLRTRIEVDHLVTPEETAAIVAAQTRDVAARRGSPTPGSPASGSPSRVWCAPSDGLVRNAPHLQWMRRAAARSRRRGDRAADHGRQRRDAGRRRRAPVRRRARGRRRRLPQRRRERHRRRPDRRRGAGARRGRLRRRVRPEPPGHRRRRRIGARATACSRTKSAARACWPR